MGQYEELMPKPHIWYSDEILYEGAARIEFFNGWAEGNAECRYDDLGHCIAKMKITSWHNSQFGEDAQNTFQNLKTLLNQEENDGIGSSLFGSKHMKCNKLIIATTQGVFEAIEPKYWWYRDADEEGVITASSALLNIHINNAFFEVKNTDKSDVRYWNSPLINFVHKYTYLKSISDELIWHPLRIMKTPKKAKDLLRTNKIEFTVQLKILKQPLISFSIGDKDCFIERLCDYKKIVNDLKDNKLKHAPTSMMVGDYDDKFEIDSIFYLLGLATGNFVIIPWIEYRDDFGNLISRIHLSRTSFPFKNGNPVIENDYLGGISSLINDESIEQLIKSPKLQKAIVNFVHVNGRSNDIGTAHRLFSLCAGLENMFDYFDVKREEDFDKLTQAQRDKIKKIYNTANKSLSRETKSATNKAEKKLIERIISRINSAHENPRTKFADKLLALLENLDFGDWDVVSNYYSNPQKWIDDINYFRNQTSHGAYYTRLDKNLNEQELEEFIVLIRHLEGI